MIRKKLNTTKNLMTTDMERKKEKSLQLLVGILIAIAITATAAAIHSSQDLRDLMQSALPTKATKNGISSLSTTIKVGELSYSQDSSELKSSLEAEKEDGTPEPDLTARLSGSSPFKVTFDMAAAPETKKKYSWDFGDGELGEGSVVTNIYTKPGSFIATLTTSSSSSARLQNRFQIIVSEAGNSSQHAIYKPRKVIQVSKIIYRGSSKHFLNTIHTGSKNYSNPG